jgi:hypothetical protein
MVGVSEYLDEKVMMKTFSFWDRKCVVDARGRKWLSVLGINGMALDQRIMEVIADWPRVDAAEND